MKRTAAYLCDARHAADRILRFTDRRSYADFATDDLLRSAVERQLEIVGEALSQLRRADPSVARQIPDLPRIVAFRNVIVHGYATLDDRLVWQVVEGQLNDLRALLVRLLSEQAP